MFLRKYSLLLILAISFPNIQLAMQPAPANQEQQECVICAEDRPGNQFLRLACTHEFCYECLRTPLANALRERRTAPLICLNPNCRRAFAQADIEQIAQHRPENDAAQVLATIADLQTREFLATLAEYKHCPTANCDGAFLNEANNRQMITCQACNQHYCSACLFNHPQRITCDAARAERERPAPNNGQRANQERQNEEWIRNNTAPCPRCRVPVQKIAGCYKMTCTRCRQEFCWKCLGRLRGYDHIEGPCVRRNNLPNEEQIDRDQPPRRPVNGRINHANDPIDYRNLQDMLRDLNRMAGNHQQPYNQVPEFNRAQFLEDNRIQQRVDNLTAQERIDWQQNIRNRTEGDFLFDARNLEQIQLEELETIERNKNRPGFRGIKNMIHPLYIALVIPPILATVRMVQWIKNPAAIKSAIRTLNALIETAESSETRENLSAQLNRDQHILTISNANLDKLREYALHDQYQEFIALATECKNELSQMTASNAGFINAFRKVRWGLSADVMHVKRKILGVFGRN